MNKLSLAAGLLALLASFAAAVPDPTPPFDTTDWITFKVEDARLAQQIPSTFLDDTQRASAIDMLTRIHDVAVGAEGKMRAEALSERLAIVQAKVQGKLSPEEADAEQARLAKALEIHLCYIYGSIVPRVYDEGYGSYVPAALRAAFMERFKRADYVALLRQDPMQGSWGESPKPGVPHNLSQPLPADADDGR